MAISGAGELRDRVSLQQRAIDDNEDRLGPWDEAHALNRVAKITSLTGGEGVQAQRLQGNQPVLIEVRACSATKAVDNTWRAVDRDNGRVFDIKTATLSKDRAFIEIMAVQGGGNG